MSSPVISIICPVYNTKKVLGKCIRSVIEQDFQDIEIILVNDGSTDGSLRVCQKYAQKDQRIKIIDKPNGGRIQARKDGVLKAQGEFVFFIDCDDYLEKNALSTLIKIAKEHHLDIVAGNHNQVYDDWGLVAKKAVPFDVADRLIDKNEWLEMLLRLDQNGNNSGGVYIWGRLYRRSCVLKAMKYDETYLFPVSNDILLEDISFNLAIAPYIRSCWMTNEALYHYRYGGAVSKFFPSISKGGFYFDNRYRLCIKNNRQDLLLYVLYHYIRVLTWEIIGRIHYQKGHLSDIYRFVENEINKREIVLWARQTKPNITKDSADAIKMKLLKSVVDNDVESIIQYAFQEEDRLQVHYRKMKLVKLYQTITENIAYYCRL